MPNEGNKRSKILIEPYLQLRFGITFIFLNIFFISLLMLVFNYFIGDVRGAITAYFSLDNENIETVKAKFLWPTILTAVIAIIFVIMTLWLAARYTHQFYGPLVSIHRFLDKMIAKDPYLEPIKIRKTDQLHGIVDRLNKLLEKRSSESTPDK